MNLKYLFCHLPALVFSLEPPEIGQEPAGFYEAIEKYDLTIVKFQAEWCGACKSMKQDYDNLAERMKGTE